MARDRNQSSTHLGSRPYWRWQEFVAELQLTCWARPATFPWPIRAWCNIARSGGDVAPGSEKQQRRRWRALIETPTCAEMQHHARGRGIGLVLDDAGRVQHVAPRHRLKEAARKDIILERKRREGLRRSKRNGNGDSGPVQGLGNGRCVVAGPPCNLNSTWGDNCKKTFRRGVASAEMRRRRGSPSPRDGCWFV